VSALGRYPSIDTVPTKSWERLCYGSAATIFVFAIYGFITTGDLMMIGAAAPFIAVFIVAFLVHRANRVKLTKARAAFLRTLAGAE